jgi:photosystem II stability/assembly factor-like uncharacterized protein
MEYLKHEGGQMTSTRIAVLLLVLGIFAFVGISWATPGSLPRVGVAGEAQLIEIKAADLGPHLGALGMLEGQGHIKLAGRQEDAGFFYAWDAALRSLDAQGIPYVLLSGDVTESEVYLVSKVPGVDRSAVEAVSRVIKEGASYYLVSVEPDKAAGVHALPAKQLLPQPYEPGIPVRVLRANPLAPRAQAMTYSPAIQALVDTVSQTSLYNLLSGFSGERQVTIGGAPYTIRTRYSTTDGCRQAAQWIKEQFEGMGIQAEYDYFNFRKYLHSVDFPVDNLTGWAVGGSQILHTDDGGQVWDRLEDGTDATLTSVFMLDNEIGWVVGSDGTILITGDGLTWQTVTTPVASDLRDIHFVDSLIGYACGVSGTILKSSDGGQSWSTLTSGTTADLNSIRFVSGTEGWVVGEGGTIRRTTNGGASWQSVSSPVTAVLNDVHFATSTTGVIVGFAGTILRTTDGATWQKITSPVADNLYAVFFLDSLRGWICGYGGTVLTTSDGGATWIDCSASLGFQLADVCFTSASEGWAVGNAALLHSTDGGATWIAQNDNIRSGDMNVVGTIPGTVNPEEIYIICGHYDDTSPTYSTYAPGADDNGTGTIAALEAARALRNQRFEATLKFVCFSREEQGLVGSGAYARKAAVRGDSIIGALNFDMIGYVNAQPEDIDIIYNGPSVWMGTDYQEAAGLYVPDLPVLKRYIPNMSSSDQKSFWDNGYCSFCGIEDMDPNNPNYHTTRDRVSTLDFSFYTKVVKGAVAMLATEARIDSVTASVPTAVDNLWLRVGPNPGLGEVSIRMAAGAGGVRSVEIYDISGRLVNRIVPSVDGGVATTVWRGDDAAGAKVAAGIYFVRTQGRSEAAKVVLVR